MSRRFPRVSAQTPRSGPASRAGPPRSWSLDGDAQASRCPCRSAACAGDRIKPLRSPGRVTTERALIARRSRGARRLGRECQRDKAEPMQQFSDTSVAGCRHCRCSNSKVDDSAQRLLVGNGGSHAHSPPESTHEAEPNRSRSRADDAAGVESPSADRMRRAPMAPSGIDTARHGRPMRPAGDQDIDTAGHRRRRSKPDQEPCRQQPLPSRTERMSSWQIRTQIRTSGPQSGSARRHRLGRYRRSHRRADAAAKPRWSRGSSANATRARA